MKELFIAEYEKIRARLIEAGCPESLADEIAGERAYDAARETLADMIDVAREQRR